MEAGRELDTLIQEKLFGWTRYVSADHTKSDIPTLRSFGIIYAWRDERGVDRGLDTPPYSTDIARAWEVVEKMREIYGVGVSVVRGDDRNVIQYAVSVWHGSLKYPSGNGFTVYAGTAPLAICRAARGIHSR